MVEVEKEIECTCPKCGHKFVEMAVIEVDLSDYAERDESRD